MTRSILDEESNHEIKLLFFNLRGFSRGIQFFILVVAIFFFHLIQGYMHVSN
jgi:hypothetical protein